MKTKEIDVWLESDEINNRYRKFGTWYDSVSDESKYTKAKLIIELPERKKEFTEREIRGIIHKGITAYRTNNETQVSIANRVSLDVFGDSDED